jgi:hypothetical protein
VGLIQEQYGDGPDRFRRRDDGDTNGDGMARTAMTEDDLKAIEARANAATPGPWEIDQKDCTVLRAPNGPPADQSLMGDEQYYPWTPDRIEDWQFIASARTDVPALIAEVRRLGEALALCSHARDLNQTRARAAEALCVFGPLKSCPITGMKARQRKAGSPTS